MNILAFSNDTGSVQWRLKNPANYINVRTEHEMYVASHKLWDGDILGSDIVVAQLWRNPEGVKKCKDQGAKVVYDADDVYFLPGHGHERKTLMKFTPEMEEQTKETIRMCDMVTVTTEALAEHYRPYNKNVVVLPNYMDFLWWGKPLNVRSVGKTIRIGWMGSDSHHEDLLMIAPVMEKILKEFPFVKFVYCGYGGMSGGFGKNVSLSKDIFTNIPVDRREYYPGVVVDYWPAKSKTLGFDIAIAPLVDDEFNAGKSAIKYMEYAANLVPGVYSDTGVYRGVVKHGVTGFLAKTQQQWYLYLSKMILDGTIRDMIVKDALQDVFTNHNLEDHYQEWVDAYRSLL